MKSKIVYLSAIVLILAFGFLYMNSASLTASDLTKKKCCKDQSTSANTNKEIKAGADQLSDNKFSTYEFATDKASSDQAKISLQQELMGAAGVKDVKFSQTCSASKMTVVTIVYAAGETSETQIASLVKDKSFDCSKMGCDENGCSKEKTGTSSGDKSDCPSCPNCPNGHSKNKKTSGKNI